MLVVYFLRQPLWNELLQCFLSKKMPTFIHRLFIGGRVLEYYFAMWIHLLLAGSRITYPNASSPFAFPSASKHVGSWRYLNGIQNLQKPNTWKVSRYSVWGNVYLVEKIEYLVNSHLLYPVSRILKNPLIPWFPFESLRRLGPTLFLAAADIWGCHFLSSLCLDATLDEGHLQRNMYIYIWTWTNCASVVIYAS